MSRFPVSDSRPERIALPPAITGQDINLAFIDSTTNLTISHITVDQVSEFLRWSYGILGRKLSISWNPATQNLASHRHVVWSRAAPSGGGLYPLNVYLVCKSVQGIPSGIYIYDIVQHALTVVRRPLSATSIAGAAAECGDLCAVVTADFWKPFARYGNFSYKLIMQDVGALVGAMHEIAYAIGWESVTGYWNDDQKLKTLLGLSTECEAPFVVLAAGKASHVNVTTMLATLTTTSRRFESLSGTKVDSPERLRILEVIRDIHRSTEVATILPRFSNAAMKRRSADVKMFSGNLSNVIRARETAWGRLRREPPVSEDCLMRLLSFTMNGSCYHSDLFGADAQLPLIRLALISQGATYLSDGSYDYCSYTSRLMPRRRDLVVSLQKICFQEHYNLDLVPIVLVFVGKMKAAFADLGERGLRVMNMETGIALERAYLACSTLRLGCGAVLGFDACTVSQLVGIDNTSELPMLLAFIGTEVRRASAFDFAIG